MDSNKKPINIANTIILFALLFGTWLVLSGYFEAFFLTVGFLSCVLAIVVTRHLGLRECPPCSLYYSLRSVGYFFWLLKEIVVSSIDVAKRVWQASPQVSPTIAWVPTKQTNDIGRTLFANSITLTPGTVSMLVYDDRLCIHALTKEGAESLKEGGMDRKISALIHRKEGV